MSELSGEENIGSKDTSTVVRVAQYVRMSTDHQRYSTENQAAAIQHYADQHGMLIVKTYADDGKSGLSLDGRDSLKRLIHDIQNDETDFEAVLVYDVSRWGRFQDTDESAYYEYICTSAGIRIVFCAESFDNDGTPIAAIVKSVKRAMAGEYSRELSVKVFAGQCRLVTLGFHQGGHAGFGLRRRLLDDRGETKAELRYGERKSLQTDRVILIPGPEEEIAIVRHIYSLFISGKQNESEIATALNQEGIVTDMNRPWTRGTVHQILTNEKYVGNNIYNRLSFKLKKKRIRNAPEKWIRANGAFEGIIDPIIFFRAREIIAERSRRLDDSEMLNLLRRLFELKGRLSGLIIDEQDDMPSSGAYRSRFGNLVRVYSLIGYCPHRDYRYIEINRQLRQLHPQIVTEIVLGLEHAGGWVNRCPMTDVLKVNDEFAIAVVIARCSQMPGGAYRWHVRFDSTSESDITVAVRMDASNMHAFDYFLFPSIDTMTKTLRLAEENTLSLDAYRVDTLDSLFILASRIPLPEAA